MPTKQSQGGLARWKNIPKQKRSEAMSKISKARVKKLRYALGVIKKYEDLRNDWDSFEKKSMKVKLEIIKNLFN